MAFLFPDLWKSRAERSGMGGMDAFVPSAIMKNGRLVIHNSMGNFAEAEKTIRNIRTQSCRKFDRRFDKRQE